MLNNLKLLNPDFVICCKDINDPALVYELMRRRKIVRSYVYGMVYQPTALQYDFIKVGMSAPLLEKKRGHQVGERIVRQIAWLPGWTSDHVKSSHGSELWYGIQDCIKAKKLPSDFDKNQLTVAVWDVSARSHQNLILTEDDDYTSARWAEGSLADQYKEANNGRLPMLNFADPSQCREYKRPHVRKDVFNQFIEFA